MSDIDEKNTSEENGATASGRGVSLPGSMLVHSLILVAFAVIVALTVGLVNEGTRDEIVFQQQQAERQALAEVLSPSLHDNDLLDNAQLLPSEAADWQELSLLGLRDSRAFYRALQGQQVSAVILPLTVRDGYSGDIHLIVGILADGSVSGVRVLSHRETPGLGDKIDRRISDWIDSFRGRSLQNPSEAQWRVRKDGGVFDQFVGATVTPRAVVNGVRQALRFFALNQDALLQEDDA